MEDIKSIVAKNISELRQANKMTQMELAEKLNYSDKAISKWERAESSPDISVLVEIADLFGVTLDYLVKAEHTEDAVTETTATEATATEATATEEPIFENALENTFEEAEERRYNRRAIAYISESGGWLVAILAFIITTLIVGRMSFQFLYFVYALPVVLIVKLVFNSVWFNPRHNYYIISLLMWSILATIQITFLYFKINVALIYLLGVAGQIIIVLCSFISKPKRNRK